MSWGSGLQGPRTCDSMRPPAIDGVKWKANSAYAQQRNNDGLVMRSMLEDNLAISLTDAGVSVGRCVADWNDSRK